jgi:hypothetical protein
MNTTHVSIPEPCGSDDRGLNAFRLGHGCPPTYVPCANKAAKKKGKARMPQQRRVRGRGDYDPEIAKIVDPVKRIERKLDHIKNHVDKGPSKAGGLIGRGLGSLLGQGDLGESAGNALQSWFGYGDYDLKSNSLISVGSTSGAMIPVFTKDGRRGIRVAEREYLGDVLSSSVSNTFENATYRINPADPRTFPWLSQIANQFEEYEMNGLIFEFKTTSAMYNGTTQALGTVTMMTDYDPTDPAPADLLTMQNADYSCSTVSSNNLQHGVECEPNERTIKLHYTSLATPSASDIRWCDIGNFNIATSGVAGTSVNLGQLWVSYDVSFYKKQLNAGLGTATRDLLVQWTSNSALGAGAIFGSTTDRTANGQIPICFDNTTYDRFQLPGVSSGTFCMIYSIFFTGVYNTTSAVVVYHKNTAAADGVNAAMNFATGYANGSSRVVVLVNFKVTGPDPILGVDLPNLTISNGATPSFTFRLFEINSRTNWPAQTITYDNL